MKIVTAESAGFCFGVRKAVDIVYREAGGPGPVYTYGPIIHNQAVVEDLEKKGVRVLRSEEELAEVKGGVIVTRSHGVSRAEEERLRQEAENKKAPSRTLGFNEAKLQVKLVVEDIYLMNMEWNDVFDELADTKPSEVYIEIWLYKKLPD